MKCRQIYRNIPYMEHLGVDGYFKVAMQIRGDPWKAGLSLSDFFLGENDRNYHPEN